MVFFKSNLKHTQVRVGFLVQTFNNQQTTTVYEKISNDFSETLNLLLITSSHLISGLISYFLSALLLFQLLILS